MSELVINQQSDLLAAPQGADAVVSSTQQSECTKLDYFIMGLLIWSSGNPAFQLLLSNSQTTYIGLLFLLLALNYRLLFSFSNSVQTFLIWGFFGGVAFFHVISGVPFRSELGLLVRLSIALVAAIRLHKYFAKLYLWWFLLLGKVSLVFWVLSLLGLLTSSSDRKSVV